MSKKEYIGDSVYVEIENRMVKLTTDNGRGPSNTIYLELEVLNQLINYLKRTSYLEVENSNEQAR